MSYNRLKLNTERASLSQYEIVETMLEESASVKSYRFSDISYDLRTIYETSRTYGLFNDVTFLWITRKCGTWLFDCSAENDWEISEKINLNLDTMKRQYTAFTAYTLTYHVGTCTWSICKFLNYKEKK